MKKLLVLALSAFSAAASGTAAAQTPAVNHMPDGSRDMYLGLGVSVQPRHEGAEEHRRRALPLLQFELSNGLFLSGMMAGWHLSQQPGLEFGPLLAVHRGRDASGAGGEVGGVSQGFSAAGREDFHDNRLNGLDRIGARLTGGAFFNYYLSPQVRLTNTVLYGAGGDGLAWETSVQRLATGIDARHRVSLAAGITVVNRDYNTAFFGVPLDAALRTGLPAYRPDGGVKDVFVGARWNWALSPAWIVTSSARLSRLTGDARNSPLVERPNQLTISTGLAHRF